MAGLSLDSVPCLEDRHDPNALHHVGSSVSSRGSTKAPGFLQGRFLVDPCKSFMAASMNWGPFLVGVLEKGALLLGIYIEALDCWMLPSVAVVASEG